MQKQEPISAHQDNHYTDNENTNIKTNSKSHTGQKNAKTALYKNTAQKAKDTEQLKTMEIRQKSECNEKWKQKKHKKYTN